LCCSLEANLPTLLLDHTLLLKLQNWMHQNIAISRQHV